MKNKKKGFSFGGSFGTGYASIIMVFVIITLTVLAALSISVAGSKTVLDERSFEHIAEYYDAENRANKVLMSIDEAAFEAAESGLFMTFEENAAQIEGVTVAKCQEGYTASWSEKVSEKLSLSCAVTVFSEPEQHGNRRYEVTEWDTVAGGSADTHINVWDGTF
ncbi:MAG: hypothetical protein IK093_12055 [Ruminiclostridium sp.]|nr:hypothetical protein [Ruminiclostridium sp.]